MTDDLSPQKEEAKFMVPRKPEGITSITLSIRPEIAEMLSDATSILKSQLTAYKDRLEKGPLPARDMEVVIRMVESIVKLSREEREVRKREKPFTDTELLATLKQMLDEGVIDVEGT